MKRRALFMSVVSAIGFVVAFVALVFPEILLAGKGVTPGPALVVWLRELGVSIAAMSILIGSVRMHADSPTLRGVLAANAALHVGLLPVEVVAHAQGTIPLTSGIVPNTIFHLVAAGGFAWFALTMRPVGAHDR